MRIYIISHKQFQEPELPSGYQPLYVGAKEQLSTDCLRDDVGDNIAARNPHYCELTGLYWIWKHGTEQIEGLCHYRRYFVTTTGKILNLAVHKQTGFLTQERVEHWLKKYDVIRHNVTFSKDSVGKQYVKSHAAESLERTGEIIREHQPMYYDAFQKIMNGRTIHLVNMMIMQKPLLDEYCEWLFAILFELENQMLLTEKNLRVMGFLAERLLDVWILAKELRAKSCFTINTERIDTKLIT